MVPPLGTFLRRFLKEFLKKTSSLGRSTVASLSWISFEEGFRFFSEQDKTKKLAFLLSPFFFTNLSIPTIFFIQEHTPRYATFGGADPYTLLYKDPWSL